MTKVKALRAFTDAEHERAKLFLATRVTLMMGRKLEEGDWTEVYCQAKNIPPNGWSNLHLDINYAGLGVELKLLRCVNLQGRSIKAVCGTTLMHPAATRSIRVDNTKARPNRVMYDVLSQYAEIIQNHTARVQKMSPNRQPDVRTGWLLWEDTLTEFLYFEERMHIPDPTLFYAEWNETPARGTRKASKSLWIFEKETEQKRYSITTHAGAKIQPYFDVPSPSDPNLYYFRVQSEPVGIDAVKLWVPASTARALGQRLGSLDERILNAAIMEVSSKGLHATISVSAESDPAVGLIISRAAYEVLFSLWDAVSDEHRAQLLLKALSW